MFWETQSTTSAGNGVTVTNLSCKIILIDAISEWSIKALQATVRVNIRQHIQIFYTLHYWFGAWFRCRERWPWHFSSVAVRLFHCKDSNRKNKLLTCLLFVCFPQKPTKLHRSSSQRNYDWLVYVNSPRSGNHPSTFSGTEKSPLPRRVTGSLGSDNALSGDRQTCRTRRLERFNHSKFVNIHNTVLQCT